MKEMLFYMTWLREASERRGQLTSDLSGERASVQVSGKECSRHRELQVPMARHGSGVDVFEA